MNAYMFININTKEKTISKGLDMYSACLLMENRKNPDALFFIYEGSDFDSGSVYRVYLLKSDGETIDRFVGEVAARRAIGWDWEEMSKIPPELREDIRLCSTDQIDEKLRHDG